MSDLHEYFHEEYHGFLERWFLAGKAAKKEISINPNKAIKVSKFC
jgi:hypothetical protein